MTGPARPERVAENLNRALHEILRDDPAAVLLGEDVADPYGGAFKITRGLSSRFPDRVLNTPLSEGGFAGVASGIALRGGAAIVEMMFSDFVTLAFDQIVNFAAKSVSMYGRRLPMRLVVRCPTGGGRGYGPTHSQSLQKHFLGVPHLHLAEASAFHDNTALLPQLLRRGEPCLLFEDKTLYPQRVHTGGVVDDLFRFDFLDEERLLARAYVDGVPRDGCDCLIIAPGGVAARALAAARRLFLDQELVCQVVVPFQLYPFDVAPLLDLAAAAQHVLIAEESTPGGTWGGEVAADLHERAWGRLRRPVLRLTSLDSVIPAAVHLERRVLLQETTIHDTIREAAGA
ncbi:alpha-ketoacid dehydrogenase subunit beta [Dactylosporangium sp. NBC_01737]|uniref:alpha-ketoacid dehydrogenase subunit beta n=1 Tax=Dactylosporangium sp. NBC_01737 TaxID=2975959 RepID=UPI002E12C16A|nr:alpha-ketoacid dehydrogenase subunit beta [Dactylosporangium sp. NBC_01737]